MMWRKGNSHALLVGMPIGVASVESNMEIPQKIDNGTALLASDSTSGNFSKENQNTNLKEYVLTYVHCRVLYKGQNLEAAQASVSR